MMASLHLTCAFSSGSLQCFHTRAEPMPSSILRQSFKSKRRSFAIVVPCAQPKESSAIRAERREEEEDGISKLSLPFVSEEPGAQILSGPTAEEARGFAGVADTQEFVPVNSKSKGAAMADFLLVYGGLLDRPFGSAQIMAASGKVVTAKVKEMARDLQDKDNEVDGQAIFELLRAISLLEADLQLLRVSTKDETLLQRLEVAKMHCRQAFLIANSL